ncbi:MAG: MFS transporter [Verrucomicrobiota bacterium]
MSEKNNSTPYGVDSLTYSKQGLITLFSWLLWGDFAFVFFEQIFGRFLPIFLKELRVSNLMIGVLSGSTVGLVNILFLPYVSQWSDSFRSKWGRRIPFLFWTTPLTVITVIFVGCAPETGAWIHQHWVSPYFPHVTEHQVIIGQLCCWVFAFNFFNMILVNSFNWLVVDIVPQFIIARFLSWFKVVGTISSCLFTWYVFPHILEYRKEVCVGVGVFYTVAFWVMCFKIKEGVYAEPIVSDRTNFWKKFSGYFSDCWSVPLYRHYFLTNIMVMIATASSASFIVLFSKETLGLSLEDMGKSFTYGLIVSAILYFIFGWLCDKMNPLLVVVCSLVGFVFISIGSYFLIQGKTSWIIYSMVSMIPGVALGIGSNITGMRIFPRERYGQFAAGSNVFGCGSQILFNFLSGKFMDWTGSNYRLIFLWSFTFFLLATFYFMKVYRESKKLGLHEKIPLPTP